MDRQHQNMKTDFLIQDQNGTYAGVHYLLDIYDADQSNNIDYIRQSIISAVGAANATLLHIHLHSFENYSGVSGVAVLAESHITVHTWPEVNYIAFDVFMCGQSFPDKAVQSLKQSFPSEHTFCSKYLRGNKLDTTL